MYIFSVYIIYTAVLAINPTVHRSSDGHRDRGIPNTRKRMVTRGAQPWGHGDLSLELPARTFECGNCKNPMGKFCAHANLFAQNPIL